MSILVGTSTSDRKDYCLDLYSRQILSFTHPDYEVFIVDNSEDINHIEKLWERGIDAIRIEPEGSPSEYICRSQNAIRDKVLYDGYEWLFMLESDVFVPLNILEYLMVYCNPVHTFAYFIDDECSSLSLQGITDKRGMRLDPLTGDYLVKGKVKPINEHKLGMEFDVYATGIGCTLIHRDILREIDFRTNPLENDIFSDIYFFEDLKRLGVKPVLDTNIIPAHYRSEFFLTDLRIYQ